jgi:hypothetical protein
MREIYAMKSVCPGSLEQSACSDRIVCDGLPEHGMLFPVGDFDTSTSNCEKLELLLLNYST